MLKQSLQKGGYLLQACGMFNLFQSAKTLIATGFYTGKDVLIIFTLLLLAAALFALTLVFSDALTVAYGSTLFVLPLVVLLDQLGTRYCRQRLNYLHTVVSYDEYSYSQNVRICPVSPEV